jgi:hypothetical protein
MLKSSQQLISIALLAGFALTGCSNTSTPVTASKPTAAEACELFEVRVQKATDFINLAVDNYEDSETVIRAGSELVDAGESLLDITSEDASVESAIAEAGRVTLSLGNLLAGGTSILSDEVNEAAGDIQFAAINAKSACAAY